MIRPSHKAALLSYEAQVVDPRATLQCATVEPICTMDIPNSSVVGRCTALLPSLVAGSADLDLSLSVTLGKDLIETCLEDTDIVVDDGLLFCWVLLTHDAYQCEVPSLLLELIVRMPLDALTC